MTRLLTWLDEVEAIGVLLNRCTKPHGHPRMAIPTGCEPFDDAMVSVVDRGPAHLAKAARLLRIVAEASYCDDCGQPETWPHDSWACKGCRLIFDVRRAAEVEP